MTGDKTGYLKLPGSGQAGRPVRRRFLPVDREAQMPGPLHVRKDPLTFGDVPFDRAGDDCRAFISVLSGQTGHDRIAVPVKSDAPDFIRLPLAVRGIREADSAFVQRSGQGKG